MMSVKGKDLYRLSRNFVPPERLIHVLVLAHALEMNFHLRVSFSASEKRDFIVVRLWNVLSDHINAGPISAHESAYPFFLEIGRRDA